MSLLLEGLCVLEFIYVVMGLCCGLLFVDMGVELIYIEFLSGDYICWFKGFGIGYFFMYSWNKKSLVVNLKVEEGKVIIYDLVKIVDIVVENFGFGIIECLGFGYEKFKVINEWLIYCFLKGFFSGFYEKCYVMDEVV